MIQEFEGFLKKYEGYHIFYKMIHESMPLKHKEIQRILKDLDFVLDRTKWSHSRFEKNGYGVTIAFHKEYPPKTAKSMLQDISRISWKEYSDILKKYNVKL